MERLAVGRWLLVLTIALCGAGMARAARAQAPRVTGQEDEAEPSGRFKVTDGKAAEGSDPNKQDEFNDSIEELEKRRKEKLRPPLEMIKTYFLPFDVLTWVKARHWTTIRLDARSNYSDYEGLFETAPIHLLSMPHEVVFRRDARMLKAQDTRISLQAMMPAVPKSLTLQLTGPDAIRADDSIATPVRQLEPHQMLIPVLAKNPNDYGMWNKLLAFQPSSGETRDPNAVDKQRYYRLVLPLAADKPMLSPHPLTWTTISHVFWDSFNPDLLSAGQQQALLDWLHWGGQLVIMGGPNASFQLLQDSFLGRYLPADPAGENSLLDEEALAPLADQYRPPLRPEDRDFGGSNPVGTPANTKRYGDAVPIRPAPKRPVFFAGLRKRDGVDAVEIPLANGSKRLLGVERRVGRGRILMLAFSPTDPALVAWPGFDTLVRRLLLRRPEESTHPRFSPGRDNAATHTPWQYACLSGPELSWLRYLSRDLGAHPNASRREVEDETVELPLLPVAEWSDDSTLPALCRQALKDASGITIPDSSFILKVLLAYVVALVPLNWLVCRFVLKRREWAWAIVPLLALGFAIGVERAAAYDLGFDSGCDEVDLLETYSGYPRAHTTRFAALFSTGRNRFAVTYPGENSALALPMPTGDEMRGERTAQSVWQSSPVPGLVNLQVQPRSLFLLHAEQYLALPGTIDLVPAPDGTQRIVNNSGLELRDAMLVEDDGARKTTLGTIAPGATFDLSKAVVASPPGTAAERWVDPELFLKPLRSYSWRLSEDKGEVRLVAWSPRYLPGQKLDPEVDRHRGMTLVVAHLRQGTPPSPFDLEYDALAVPSTASVDLDANVPVVSGGSSTSAGGGAGAASFKRRLAESLQSAAPVAGIAATGAAVTSFPAGQEAGRP